MDEKLWHDPGFVAEVVSAVALVLFLVADVVTHLNPDLVAIVGLVLFIVFVVSLLYRKNSLDAKEIAIRKLELQTNVDLERHKMWMAQAGGMTSESTRSHAKLEGIVLVRGLIEEVLRRGDLPRAYRKAYEDMLGRVSDLERGASPFPVQILPLAIQQQMEAAQGRPPPEGDKKPGEQGVQPPPS